MAEVKTQSEPSMEEILASIRRIIAEDEASPAAPPPPQPARPAVAEAPQPAAVPAQDAILDLTDRIDDDLPPKRPAPVVPPITQTGIGLGGARMTRPPPLKTGATPPEPPKRIVSDSTVAASVATLQHLASMGNSGRQQELPLGDAGRTLEEMVRELLRPHLKEWLDAHLPRLVERLVRDEINRLVRDAQER